MSAARQEAASRLALAEALCARLCHDLGGPLATITGSIDLAAEEAGGNGDGDGEALSLARESAAALGARVRLLRAAWGGTDDPLDVGGLIALCAGLSGSGRIALNVQAIAPGSQFSPAAARLLLNAVLLAAEALRGPGQIALSGSADEIIVTVDGPRASWPEGLSLLLADPATALADRLDPRLVQGPFTALAAAASGLRAGLLLNASTAEAGIAPLLLRFR